MRKIQYSSFKWINAWSDNRAMAKLQPFFRGIVVDLGCGSAPYKEDVLKTADRYVGVDWGNSYHNTRVDIEADLNKPLPIEENFADVVTSFSVLEHLHDPLLLMQQCERILKPGGTLIMTVPMQWQIHEEPYDYFRYTEYGMRCLGEKAKFENIRVLAPSGFWYVIGIKICYFLEQHVNRHLHPLLVPIWFLIQCAIPLLDRFSPGGREAIGYTVIAQKKDYLAP